MNKDTLLFEYLISNPDAYSICKNIIEPEYFNKEIQPAVRYVIEYVDKYRTLPSIDMIEAETNVSIKIHEDALLPDRMRWICDEIETHCRIERTIIAIQCATEMIAQGDLAGIIEPIKDAVLLSTNRDMGLDYLSDPTARLEAMKNRSNVEPTGFADLDHILYGGIERGGLNIFAAGSGAGKSYFMANVGLNWLLRGKNVLYISFELHESPVAKRLDSMVSGIDTRKVLDEIDKVADSINRTKLRTKGSFRIKYLPAQSRVRDIEAYLSEYILRTGIKPDLIIFDYLELIMPNDVKIDVSDHFTKDKMTAEQLRAMLNEYGLYSITASQLNRSAVASEEHDQSHIAGGISKINTADVVATLLQTKTMRDNNIIKIQFLKTRNSAGVGKHLYLQIDPVTVRYSDAPPDVEALLANSAKRTPAPPRASLTGQNAQGQRVLDQIRNRQQSGR